MSCVLRAVRRTFSPCPAFVGLNPFFKTLCIGIAIFFYTIKPSSTSVAILAAGMHRCALHIFKRLYLEAEMPGSTTSNSQGFHSKSSMEDMQKLVGCSSWVMQCVKRLAVLNFRSFWLLA